MSTRRLAEMRVAEARGPGGVGRCLCVAAGLVALSYAAISAVSSGDEAAKLRRELAAARAQLEAHEGGRRVGPAARTLYNGPPAALAPATAAVVAPTIWDSRASDPYAAATRPAPVPAEVAAASAARVQLARAAATIRSPTCRAAWLRERRAAPASAAHVQPLPYAGGDLEAPGVMEAALAARAPDRELIFLSVGDTRDHRRMDKDPSLKTISVDFLLNLLANLKQLNIGHYLILTTEKLCRKLQDEHCEYACAWTSLWDEHAGLAPWGLKRGDMFLMWAQQWRYVARAMELGHRVMRADTDVYFAEDPYAVLHGPLFSHFQMVVQHDFFGARERPKCEPARPKRLALAPSAALAADAQLPACGLRGPHLALLNIGLVYLNSAPGGGVFAVINGTWGRFLARLGEPPSKPAHLNGKVDSQALIDQPFMRSALNDLAVADDGFAPRKPANQWAVVPGGAGDVYGAGVPCALADARACAAVAAERAKTAFLVQAVRPPRRSAGARAVAERVALAPDWLFGRGCLTHLRAPLELLKLAKSGADAHGGAECKAAPTALGHAPLAPGPAAGLLVGTHFVYSMALKRKRAFRAFGWDLGDARNRTADGAGCFGRSNRAMLLGHTFFDQTADAKSVLCSLPAGDAPGCSCCVGLPSLKDLGGPSGYRLETTGGSAFRNDGLFRALEGCNDYQMFWD